MTDKREDAELDLGMSTSQPRVSNMDQTVRDLIIALIKAQDLDQSVVFMFEDGTKVEWDGDFNDSDDGFVLTIS